MQWTLVTAQDQLQQVLAEHRRAPAVAVDTEFMRRNTFFPKVALLQLCFDDHAWLIDPLAIDDLQPLRRLLAAPAITKVLHSASEDLELFACWLGVQPVPLFDTQRAAGLLDLGFGVGYRGLVAAHCGVAIDKGETRSDWLQRPLTAAQCDYAALDVAYLLPLFRLLRERAEDEGKLAWILEDGAVACAGAGSSNGDYARRVKGAGRLGPRQYAALVRLCQWREAEAQARDKPRSWILDDRACLALASAMPRDRGALSALDALPQPVLRRSGDALLAAIDAARHMPEAALPAPPAAPLGPEERRLLKRLKGQARALAERYAVAPELLLAGRDLEALLQEYRGVPVPEPPHWRGWRADRAIAPLRRFLREAAG